MSAGGFAVPKCSRCGKRPGVIENRLIGGWFCKPCDRYVTSPAPDLEAQYNARVAARKKEATS
jgi:ribosomal protein L37AE/L43A